MCTVSRLNYVTACVVNEARKILKEKFCSAVLFGSYARGDYDDESDIDILLLVNCEKNELPVIKKALYKVASNISLENDVEVSLTLVQRSTYENYKDCYPFYENIEAEGINIA